MAQERSLEVILSMVAAVGGTLAGVGGFWIAFHQMARDEVQRTPAIHLSCRREYRLAEIAQGIAPPEETLLLTESGGQWAHVGGKGSGPQGAQAPEPFARCDVRNFSMLPVLNIQLPLHLAFSASGAKSTTNSRALIEIPGLSPGASWEFSMLNATGKQLTFSFERTVAVTRVDQRREVQATLFTDSRMADLERAGAAPTLARAPAVPASAIVIRDFSFAPRELHVKAGATVAFENRDDEAHAIVFNDKTINSGVIDAHATWRHVFRAPGRYPLHCDYHPYMEAAIVVE